MAKYIKQEFKSIRGEGEASAYYRMETTRKVTMVEFVKEISIPGYGISEATAVAQSGSHFAGSAYGTWLCGDD